MAGVGMADDWAMNNMNMDYARDNDYNLDDNLNHYERSLLVLLVARTGIDYSDLPFRQAGNILRIRMNHTFGS